MDAINILLIKNSWWKFITFVFYYFLYTGFLIGCTNKECTPSIRTSLLSTRNTVERQIVKGENLIAFYYHNNPGCETADGWFSQEVSFEFENFQPELEKEYMLPQKQIKILYRSTNSDGPEVYSQNDLTGKIIFHEFANEKIKLSLFLEAFGKYPLINLAELEFKASTEKIYEGDNFEPMVK